MGTLIKIAVVIAVAYGGYVVWHNKHKAVAHTFEVHGGEAYDAATNLTWKRCGVGQEFTPNRRQIFILASFTTGCLRPYRSTADLMLSVCCSPGNFGE